MAFSWSGSAVAFKRVASIVIFTYVAANVVNKEESATRMLSNEFIHVKDEVIEKD